MHQALPSARLQQSLPAEDEPVNVKMLCYCTAQVLSWLAQTAQKLLRLGDTIDCPLPAGDELVLLTEHRNCQPQPQMGFPHPGEYPELEDMQATEMVLFLGWPDDLPSLIMVLDPLVMQGSELWLYSDVSGNVPEWAGG